MPHLLCCIAVPTADPAAVRHFSGPIFVLLCSGACTQACVAQLLHEVTEMETARQKLGGDVLGLTEEYARLNDAYIVAVSEASLMHRGSVACMRHI
jgi:hypothetical protein